MGNRIESDPDGLYRSVGVKITKALTALSKVRNQQVKKTAVIPHVDMPCPTR